MKKAFLGVLVFAVLIPLFLIALMSVSLQQASASFHCAPAGVGERIYRGAILTEQRLLHAEIIVATGESLRLSREAHIIALATAMVEDNLDNSPEQRDKTSVGLFQQQLSINGGEGWGTLEELTDPALAAALFYEGKDGFPGLVDQRDWERRPPGEVAQAVQRSAHPDRYAAAIPFATSVHQHLRGVFGNCVAAFGDVTGNWVDVTFTNGETTKMDSSVAPAMQRLIDDASEDGINFTGWGGRSHQRQHELRRINGCADGFEHVAGENPAMFDSPSNCRVPTARPGQSKHESGLAMDFKCGGSVIGSRDSACFRWLNTNAIEYGFKNLPSEPWHWSTTGG